MASTSNVKTNNTNTGSYDEKTNFKNQESYLKGLQQKGNEGQQKWAAQELKSLYAAADQIARDTAYSVNAGKDGAVDSNYLFGRGVDDLVAKKKGASGSKSYNAYRDYYGLQNQISSLNRYYDQMGQLYANKMQRKQHQLPQMLAAAGMSGGAAEKELARVEKEYANLLLDNETARKITLAEMQQNMNSLQQKGGAALLANAAKWQKKLAELWSDYEKMMQDAS